MSVRVGAYCTISIYDVYGTWEPAIPDGYVRAPFPFFRTVQDGEKYVPVCDDEDRPDGPRIIIQALPAPTRLVLTRVKARIPKKDQAFCEVGCLESLQMHKPGQLYGPKEEYWVFNVLVVRTDT